MLILGIDAGFGNIKVVTKFNEKEIKIDFPSRVKEVEIEGTDTITFNNKVYSFTEGNLIVDNGHLSKNNEETKVLLWKAMYEVYLKTGETDFDISFNCALDSYKQDKGLEVQEAMLKETEVIVKERFKEEVTFRINNLTCSPECLMGGLLSGLKLKEEEVVMIDLGTLNLQGIHVIKAVPQYNTTFSTSYGMQHIYRSLADLVKVKEKGLSSHTSIQMYLEKTASGSFEVLKNVEDVILNHLLETTFNEIDIELNKLKMSMFSKIVLLGGGSVTMKRFLDVKFTDKDVIYVKDAYWANARGLYKRGERLYMKPATKKVGEK